MTTKVVLLCPHADDEVIGGFGLIQKGWVSHIIYTEPLEPHRLMEAETFSSEHLIEMEVRAVRNEASGSDWVRRLEDLCADDPFLMVFGPDPHWELHPHHKKLGQRMIDVCRELGMRFGTYSTNMNAPYIRELSPSDQKEKWRLLNTYFSSQASLWKYDFRYFLFEGICEWDRGV